MFKTGSTLKCRNALSFNFTALTHLCFSVALTFILYHYKVLVVSFGFNEVIDKILIAAGTTRKEGADTGRGTRGQPPPPWKIREVKIIF